MQAITAKKDGTLLIVRFTANQLRDKEAYQIGAELRVLTAQTSVQSILLNFEGVEYLTSTMIGQLFKLRNICKAKNIAVKVCGLSPAVRSVVEIVRLPKLIDVYEDEQAARDALDGEFDVASEDEERPEIEQLIKDAESGDAEGRYQLGKCHDEGNGVPQNSAEAIVCYRKAAEQGHASGQYMLGNAFAYGIEVEQDYDTALLWYRTAADQGHIEAQYNLGMSCHYGIGIDKDYDEASAWYSLAANQGHEPSQTALAQMRELE